MVPRNINTTVILKILRSPPASRICYCFRYRRLYQLPGIGSGIYKQEEKQVFHNRTSTGTKNSFVLFILRET